MFLLSLHIDFMGIPIVPGILGCLVFRSGFRMLERVGDLEGFGGGTVRWNSQADCGWALPTGPDSGRWFMRQSKRISSTDHTAVLMLAETACGCSTLNHWRWRAWQAVYVKLQKYLPPLDTSYG